MAGRRKSRTRRKLIREASSSCLRVGHRCIDDMTPVLRRRAARIGYFGAADPRVASGLPEADIGQSEIRGLRARK